MTNKDVFQVLFPQNRNFSVFAELVTWAPHSTHFTSWRIVSRSRQTGGPYLKFKDVLKRDLHDFYIDPNNFTTIVLNRGKAFMADRHSTQRKTIRDLWSDVQNTSTEDAMHCQLWQTLASLSLSRDRIL